LLVLWFASLAAGATGPEPRPALRAEVEVFIAEMAAKHGFNAARLRALLAKARPLPAIVKAMSAPATARPWHEYSIPYLSPARIEGGVRFWEENAAALARARARYDVPEELIVATIGVETIYGRLTGTHRVLDVLATLAFDYPPRASYFRGELEQFLLLARQGRLDPEQTRGSYAGAMGIPQFMPSTYERYAVDFDGDGKITLWAGAADAIGSVAHYYQTFGWQPRRPVVVAASVTGDGYRSLMEKGLRPQTPAAQLREAGITALGELADEEPVSLFALETADGPRYWLALKNFYVITRYNRSVNYAMSVYLLGREIRARREGTAAARAPESVRPAATEGAPGAP
jgi:membrane-bound lytic murein transglycosylase B